MGRKGLRAQSTERARALRAEGKTNSEIASELGFSKVYIWELIGKEPWEIAAKTQAKRSASMGAILERRKTTRAKRTPAKPPTPKRWHQ